jgi:flagella basal body P-ring formation protein FlgA
MKSNRSVLRYRLLPVFLWIAVFLTTVPADDAAALSASLRLAESARVSGPNIVLSDLGHISCADAGDCSKLEKIVIGSSPLPGKSRIIDAEAISLRLRQHDVDPTEIVFQGAAEIRVYRDSREIDEGEIRKIISEFIRTGDQWADAEVSIKGLHIGSDRCLPKGRTTYRVAAPQRLQTLSNVPLSIVFDVDGNFQKSIAVTVQLEALVNAVTAARPIGRLRPITAEDLKVVRMNRGELPIGVLSDLDEVIGRRARRNIDAGTALRPDLIEIPPTVNRGDTVVIVAQGEGLRITAKGEVREPGYRGERVKVVNLDSNKRIMARVVDKNTVSVDF